MEAHINYAHPQYAGSHPLLHLKAKEKFEKDGAAGAFSAKKFKRFVFKYAPGEGVGAPTPTGESIVYQGNHPGETYEMMRYSDGSLRKAKEL
jgi:hypothetical protein